MKARIISLISGVMTMAVVLCLQLITACSNVETNAHTAVNANLLNISALVKSGMLEKMAISSVVIILISIVVLYVDKYLDNQALKNKE